MRILSSKSKKSCLTEREDVVQQLDHLKEYMLAEVDVEPDEGDAEIVEREKNAVLIGVLERKLKDIDAALRSIDKGHYGICERCGEEIEVGRLEIKPDATHVREMPERGRTACAPWTSRALELQT